jgi:hypothetical protein
MAFSFSYRDGIRTTLLALLVYSDREGKREH